MKKLLSFCVVCILALNVYANGSEHIKSSQPNVDVYNYDYAMSDNECDADIHDPLEKINRLFFYFNGALDYVALRPLAIIYDKSAPAEVKRHVKNMMHNFSMPLTSVNYVLQGNIKNALRGFWSFVINSTIGIGGLFDIAKSTGLSVEPQNIGDTFAYYGAQPGIYIVLPFFGMTNSRDVLGVVFGNKFNFIRYYIDNDALKAIDAINMVDARADALKLGENISNLSSDIYVTLRTINNQTRERGLKHLKKYRCNYKK